MVPFYLSLCQLSNGFGSFVIWFIQAVGTMCTKEVPDHTLVGYLCGLVGLEDRE